MSGKHSSTGRRKRRKTSRTCVGDWKGWLRSTARSGWAEFRAWLPRPPPVGALQPAPATNLRRRSNALFAYEAAAGGRFESGLLATGDIDLAFDARRALTFATDLPRPGLMAALQDVDASFQLLGKGDYRAANRDGFLVDLIRPAARLSSRAKRVPQADEAFGTAEVWKLQWIFEAPRMSAVAVAEDGLPIRMEVPDPRWFAAHEAWLSKRDDRDPAGRERDPAQAEAVAVLAARHLPGMALDDGSLASLPLALRDWLREAATRQPPIPMEW